MDSSLKIYLLVVFATIHSAHAETAIRTAGVYGAGRYYLDKDIMVEKGDGLVFPSTASLDMRGYCVRTSQGGNIWDFGIRMEGGNSVLFNSRGRNGCVAGFRVGVKITGSRSKIRNVDFIQSRYMAIWVDADDVEVLGGEISELGGVSDEKYAIGIQVAAARFTLARTVFKNIYPQRTYFGDKAGEGLAVNLSAQSVNAHVSGIKFHNDNLVVDTIGIFAGSGGRHRIDNSNFFNVSKAVQMAVIGPPTTVSNVVAVYSVGAR